MANILIVYYSRKGETYWNGGLKTIWNTRRVKLMGIKPQIMKIHLVCGVRRPCACSVFSVRSSLKASEP